MVLPLLFWSSLLTYPALRIMITYRNLQGGVKFPTGGKAREPKQQIRIFRYGPVPSAADA